MTVDSKSQTYPTHTAMFTTVGEGTFRLGDIKAKNMEWGADFIQFLDPTTSKVDDEHSYIYWESDEEDGGWYYKNHDEDIANDDTFPLGTAFLCAFSPSRNPQLTFAGQVLTADVTIKTKVDDAYVPYMFVGNPYPVRLPLKNIKAPGAEWGADFIQVLDAASSKVDPERSFIYWDSEEEDGGWYYKNHDEDMEENEYIEVGEGFLCAFGTSRKIDLQIKSPIAK